MALSDDLSLRVDGIFGTKFDQRDGAVIPESDSVKLRDGAVNVDATFLYADLAGSSRLAQVCQWSVTAKLIRAYLDCAVRIIRRHGGEIRSFDGDRVMGVFIRSFKNTNASYAARGIDWAVHHVLNPKAQKMFKSIRDANYNVRHCVGVDSGDTRAVRAGVRDNNDIIWIGKAPSFAAKLSDVRDYPREVYVSSRVYNKLPPQAKIVDGSSIWEARTFTFAGSKETVYCTTILKAP